MHYETTITNKSDSAARIWDVVYESSESLRKTCEDCYTTTSKGFTSTDLGDVFLACYQTAEPVFGKTRVGRFLTEYISRSPSSSWVELREWTKRNPVESAIAAMSIWEDLIVAAYDAEGNVTQHGMGTLSDAVRKAKSSDSAATKLAEQVGLNEGYRGSGSGQSDSDDMLTMEEQMSVRLTLAQALRKRGDLNVLFNCIGRLVAQFEAHDGLRNVGGHDREDVTVGRDLPSVLPSEFARDDDQFDSAFLDGRLSQYESTQVEREGLGPIIALIDKSGSMNCPMQGAGGTYDGLTRDDFATALAVALVTVARKQGRDIAILPFTQYLRDPIHSSGGRLSVDQVAKLVRMSAGGGTDIAAAIDSGLARLDSQPNADVLLLTDGDDDTKVRAKWLQMVRAKLEEHAAKIITMNIGNAGTVVKEASSELHEQIEQEQKTDEVMSKLMGHLSERRKHFLETDWS